MVKGKKSTYVLLIVVSIAVVLLTGTYAWFTWTSTNNPNITLTIGDIADVTFTSGPNINVNNLSPVFNYTDGESTTFSIINKNSNNGTIEYRVIFNVTSIDSSLISNQLKYVLLKGSTVIGSGNFSTANNGGVINLGGGVLPSNTSNYTFYIYIDGNDENNLNMMNKNLSGTLEVTASLVQ